MMDDGLGNFLGEPAQMKCSFNGARVALRTRARAKADSSEAPLESGPAKVMATDERRQGIFP